MEKKGCIKYNLNVKIIDYYNLIYLVNKKFLA